MTSPVPREIAAEQTHDLRRRVLRAGRTDTPLDWDGDHEATTFHLGVLVDGRIVAISTWLARHDPIAPERTAMQLRGMATAPDVVGQGAGSALLRDGTTRARSAGYDRIWANARIGALDFYIGAGWTVTGPVFHTEATDIPHRHVHLDLEESSPGRDVDFPLSGPTTH